MANTRSKVPSGKKRKPTAGESSGTTDLVNLVSNFGNNIVKEVEQMIAETQAISDDRVDRSELEKMEKDMAVVKKEAAGKQKEIAALKKEVAGLKKEVKKYEGLLTEERVASEKEKEELKQEVIEGCKKSTMVVLAKARLQMLKEMKDPKFDQSKWDTSKWEACVKENEPKVDHPEDHNQDQGKDKEPVSEDVAMEDEDDEGGKEEVKKGGEEETKQ